MSGPRKHPGALLALCCVLAWPVAASGGDAEDEAHRSGVAALVESRRERIYAELSEFLSIPNVSSDRESIRRNVDHLRGLLEGRGLRVRVLEAGGAPYVFAHLPPEDLGGGTRPRRVLFYCHFDGQPVDPSRWTVTDPFRPRLVGELDDPDSRVYARSASDDKSPIIALLAAIDVLREAGIPPTVDARFLFDPEEEIGSPNIDRILSEHAGLLGADLMIFADGPVHQSGRTTAVFGTRGIVTARITVYGPDRALHSGHYGNWAPNPAEKLAALLASMKDADGRVLVAGFYDDVIPLSPREQEALAAIPPVETTLAHELLIARPDGADRSLQELINLPSLNVRGMASAWVGDAARTIVPDTATAELDLRLVKGIDPRTQVQRLIAHVREQGFHVVEEEPDAETRRRHARVAWISYGKGVPATRTSMDTAVSRALIEAVRRASTDEPVLMPTLGGTGPLYPFERSLGLPVYGVPIVNPDNNQHAPDENLRLGNLWHGIVLYASLLRFPPPVS